MLIPAIEPTDGLARVMRHRRGVDDPRLLCLGARPPVRGTALTGSHNGLALDRPPFDLRARSQPVEVVAGVRIGLTKAVELPWRYGLAGSRFLSKPFRKT